MKECRGPAPKSSEKFNPEVIYVIVEEDRHGYDYTPLFWTADLDMVHDWIDHNENTDTMFTYFAIKQLAEF